MKKGILQFTSAPEINADEIAPAWVLLAPFGEHPSRDGKRVQVLDAESAAELVAAFNFWPRRVARLMEINTVPVWLGHPDFAPHEWPEKIQLGHVAEIAARDGALWGRVEWNAKGLEVLSAREHRFPSVAWEVVYNGTQRGTPINLWSVGIWRAPNIRSTPPIVAAEINSEQEANNEPEPDTMKDKLHALLVKLGLIEEKPADESAALAELETTLASNAEAAAKVATMQESADAIAAALAPVKEALKIEGDAAPLDIINAAAAALTEKASEADEMETELNALRDYRVDTELAAALASGALTKAQLPAARAKLAAAADFKAALAEINAQAPRLNMRSLTLPTRARNAVMDARERRAEINAWTEAKMKSDGITYDAAVKLAKAEFPDHFKRASKE